MRKNNVVKYRNQGLRYHREAKRLLDKKDFAQASEKLWGATASFVKAVADSKNLSHDGHAQLFKVIDILSKKTNDADIDKLFHLANTLHTNFYENWLTPAQVIRRGKDVDELIQKLKKVLE